MAVFDCKLLHHITPEAEAAQIARAKNGTPANRSVTPFILSAIAQIALSGMMRHGFGMVAIGAPGSGLMGLIPHLFFGEANGGPGNWPEPSVSPRAPYSPHAIVKLGPAILTR